MLFRSVTVMTFISAIVALTGCTNATRPRDPGAVKSIVDTRVEVVKAENNLHDTVIALQDLKKGQGDPKIAYQKLVAGMEGAQKHAATARETAADMRFRSADYERKWEEETSRVINPDVKVTAEERLATFKDRYAKLRDTREATGPLYEKFIADLETVKNSLSPTVTKADVDKARPAIDKAIADGDELTKNVSDLVAQMNVLTASMTKSGKVPEM